MPPKKIQKKGSAATSSKKAPNKDEAEDMILNYLKSQNRPYSAIDVFNNLRGVVGKAVVQKTLSQMADDKRIHGKAYGKQFVYVADQNELEVPSQDEVDKMDENITQLKETISTSKEDIRSLQSTINSLATQMLTNELRAKLEETKKFNSDIEKRLLTLREGLGVQVSEKEKERVNKMYDLYRQEWKRRKRLFKNPWDQISEGIQGKKPAEFMEDLGIETDEMVNQMYTEPKIHQPLTPSQTPFVQK